MVRGGDCIARGGGGWLLGKVDSGDWYRVVSTMAVPTYLR